MNVAGDHVWVRDQTHPVSVDKHLGLLGNPVAHKQRRKTKRKKEEKKRMAHKAYVSHDSNRTVSRPETTTPTAAIHTCWTPAGVPLRSDVLQEGDTGVAEKMEDVGNIRTDTDVRHQRQILTRDIHMNAQAPGKNRMKKMKGRAEEIEK